MNDNIIKGTELKYLMAITAPGFTMADDWFSVDVSCGGITKTIPKTDCVFDADQDAWYLCFDTNDFRSGLLVATVTALVPDNDFPDGLRTEIVKCELGTLKSS